MRIAVRVAAVLALLVVAALVALAITLPRLVDRPEVRARIETAAREATGRDVRFEGLAVGLLPPRVRVLAPSVSGAASGDPPLFTADEVSLRIALLPLLARQLVVDSLSVDAPRVHVVRLPAAAGAAAAKKAPAGSEAPSDGAGAPVHLAVRSFRLRDGRVVFEDRASAKPVTWTFEDVDGDATGTSPDAPIDFELSAALGTGGTLRARGNATTAGAVDAELSLSDANIATGRIALRGSMVVRVQLAGAPAALTGSFDVDATAAELEYQGGFKKPPGTPATVSGRLVRDPGGAIGVDELRVKVKNLDAQGHVRTGARTRVHLETTPFDVAGWETLLPALGGATLGGQLRPGVLDVATGPLDLRGAPSLAAFSFAPPGRSPIIVDGGLDLAGDAVRSRDLVVRVAGQPFRVGAELQSLAASPRYSTQVAADAVDGKALVNEFGSRKDVFEGPVTLKSAFSGPLGGGKPVAETVSGRARLDVGRGRLRGVSLLQSTVDRLGAVGQAALVAGRLEGGKTLQRFYEDEFESIGGTFVVGGGRASTDDLRLVYRHYTVDLRGVLGLLDQALDMTGTLTIGEEVDSALAAQAGGGASGGGQRVIPLAHVTGTVSDPKVSVTAEAATTFLASYTLGRKREKLERKIDEKLGEGAGREVMDALDSLLGGKKKTQ